MRTYTDEELEFMEKLKEFECEFCGSCDDNELELDKCIEHYNENKEYYDYIKPKAPYFVKQDDFYKALQEWENLIKENAL